jgi:hypothetical protein
MYSRERERERARERESGRGGGEREVGVLSMRCLEYLGICMPAVFAGVSICTFVLVKQVA